MSMDTHPHLVVLLSALVMGLVAELRTELVAAEAASTLPAAPAADTVEAMVVALHTWALADKRFQAEQ